MKKSVVITGCGGRLGQQFIQKYQDQYDIYGVSSKVKNNNFRYNHIQSSLSRYNEIIDNISNIDCWINNAYNYNMLDPKKYQHGFLQEVHVGVVIPHDSACYLFNKWKQSGDWSKNKSILNISSIAAVKFYDISQTTYAACKSALNRITVDLAKSFVGKVRVNAICPNTFPYYVPYDVLFNSMINFIDGNDTAKIQVLDSNETYMI